MSILARSTCAPSGNSPARIRRSRSRFSSTERSRIRAGRAGHRDRAAALADLLLALRIDVRLARLDQRLGDLVQPLEVVAGEALLVPLEAEPADVVLDGLDVPDVLGGRVGVVEPQVAAARELARRCRSSGRWTWRGRCAGSRSARAETGCGSAGRSGRSRRPRRPSRGGSPCAAPRGRRRRAGSCGRCGSRGEFSEPGATSVRKSGSGSAGNRVGTARV